MVVTLCEFCNKELLPSNRNKRFCNPICQGKDYSRRPEIREKNRIRIREYRRNHPEWKEKHRILQAKYKEKRKIYLKEYGKREEVRTRIRDKEKLRRKNDLQFAIANRLRKSLGHALTKYSLNGKIMSSRKYGLDWKIVINHLKPFPKDMKIFEIDHIRPLSSFNLNNLEEVKIAFSPENLQWLPRSENRSKSDKHISPILPSRKSL